MFFTRHTQLFWATPTTVFCFSDVSKGGTPWPQICMLKKVASDRSSSTESWLLDLAKQLPRRTLRHFLEELFFFPNGGKDGVGDFTTPPNSQKRLGCFSVFFWWGNDFCLCGGSVKWHDAVGWLMSFSGIPAMRITSTRCLTNKNPSLDFAAVLYFSSILGASPQIYETYHVGLNGFQWREKGGIFSWLRKIFPLSKLNTNSTDDELTSSRFLDDPKIHLFESPWGRTSKYDIDMIWEYIISTVDGQNPFNQLQVVYPIIYKVLYIPGGCLGFRPSTVSQLYLYPIYFSGQLKKKLIRVSKWGALPHIFLNMIILPKTNIAP